jgi:hypothetical protein
MLTRYRGEKDAPTCTLLQGPGLTDESLPLLLCNMVDRNYP